MTFRRLRAASFGPPCQHRVPCAAVGLMLGAMAPLALADVYKCAGEGGTPVYQETPCPAGKQLRNFQTDPPEITILPSRPGPGAAPATSSAPRAKAEEKPEKAAKGNEAPAGKRDPAQRQSARVGMTESEVLAKLGTPDITSGQPNQKSVRWTWLPAEGDPDMTTTMTLSNGIVVDIERRTLRK